MIDLMFTWHARGDDHWTNWTTRPLAPCCWSFLQARVLRAHGGAGYTFGAFAILVGYAIGTKAAFLAYPP